MQVEKIGCPYQPDKVIRPDPCAEYLSLRDTEPVAKDDLLGVWVVTGFAEVSRLLRNPALSSAWPTQGNSALHEVGSGSRTNPIVRKWFMFQDGEPHSRLRRLVAPLFTAESLTQKRPFIESVVSELLDGRGGTFDVMADLAVPLSSRVICQVLGLPQELAPCFKAWARDVDAVLVADYLAQAAEQGERAVEEMADAVEATLHSPYIPDDSGIGLLQQALQAGEIELEDALATATLLIHAGFETTSTFIGKAVRAACHADAWKQLVQQGSGSAVDELLRFDTSVQQVARVATEPVDIAGRRIEAGDLVLLMLGVANRDAREFPAPDSLAPGRPIRRHLAFGLGSHYCLGSRLGRLEAEVALDGMAQRWSTLSLTAPPVTRSHNGVMVLERLDIEIH